MSGFLDDSFENLENIKWLLEEIINIINHIDITSIIKELNKAGEKDLFNRPNYFIYSQRSLFALL